MPLIAKMIISLSIVLCIALLCGFSFFGKPYSKDIGEINDKTCNELKKFYSMECVGKGLGLASDNERVQNIYIRFSIQRVMALAEARKLSLNALDVMMKNVNENKRFLESYAVPGFNESNINMSIYFRTPEGTEIFDPNIGTVSIMNGQIDFRTDDPEKPNRYKSEIRETIEEARQKALSE